MQMLSKQAAKVFHLRNGNGPDIHILLDFAVFTNVVPEIFGEIAIQSDYADVCRFIIAKWCAPG